ncbi:MAG: hypothetical protein JW786_12505 [Desulfobacterales bacterium]|nr:hypothetical protein [Desulfobacterales bacterium]
MHIKKHIKELVKDAFLHRTRSKQLRHLKMLVGHLRAKHKYSKYPLAKHPPIIKQYPFCHHSDLKWLDFYYSVFGSPDPLFIPVPVYYYIETCLNNRMLTFAIKEKNFLNKFMPAVPTPKTIVRRINGFCYDDQYQRVDRNEVWRLLNLRSKLILKPSVESGGGSSIRVLERKGSALSDAEGSLNPEWLDSYIKDFVVQEYIVQHRFFSQFNPSSNNTIRVFTYRSVKDDSVNILHCLLRVGAQGSFLDHDHLGGVVLAIDEHNKTTPQAIDLFGNKYNSVNGIDLAALDSVPVMDEVRKLAREVAGNVYYGRLLALDFTVDRENRPLLLEINCWRNGISQYQMHNGGLFKEFTIEILDFCQKAALTLTLSL